MSFNNTFIQHTSSPNPIPSAVPQSENSFPNIQSKPRCQTKSNSHWVKRQWDRFINRKPSEKMDIHPEVWYIQIMIIYTSKHNTKSKINTSWTQGFCI